MKLRVPITAQLLVVSVLLIGTRLHAATVTRGPYLQMPTASSVIVRWRTDVATTSRVLYGAAPGSLTQMVDDAASTTEHVVTVGSLAADTKYFYAIGSDVEVLVGDDADHFFRTTPVNGPARPMRIWVTGDGGFADANGMAVRDAYANFDPATPTDLWLLLGDNAYVLGSDANYQAALFDMHHDLLRSVPVWSTFGNHEALSSNSLTQTGPYFSMFNFPTAAEVGGIASGTESYYSFDYANVHFVVLDSESHTTPAINPMTTWLTADLEATTADWIIAIWHRPPYSKGLLHDSDVEANEINMRTNVVPILEDYGVDLVLCGHSHNYERSYLIDGHYGLSTTFTSAHQVDAGDGDPAGDGEYRKPVLGPAPHDGAVYAVVGSSSEVRNTTLNHPAHVVGLLRLGSLIMDISGNTLTATFLAANGQTPDTFRIIKGSACPPVPALGCQAGARGRMQVRTFDNHTRDRFGWKWTHETIDAAQLGTPSGQTDLAACVYDQDGVLLGGAILHGAPEWSSPGPSLVYRDRTGSRHGLQQIRIRPGTGATAQIVVKGKGTALGAPALPATAPVTAQLINIDTGACWASTFSTTRRNDPTLLVAGVP
jgi:hypothetical protein